MLSINQVHALFDELEIPRERIAEGSSIDIICPFEKQHTNHDGRPSCRLYFNTHPHLHCLHVHCTEEIRDKNTWLRLLILGSTDFPEDAQFGSEETPRYCGDYGYARAIVRKLPRILKAFQPSSWPPEPIKMSVPEFLQRLRVFKKDDLIWIGDVRSSGLPMHATHFRTLAGWRENPPHPLWSYITGATYLSGSYSRTKDKVAAVRLLILESDARPQPEAWALAKWIENEFNLPHLACVHSGNKSLHNYFPYPGLDWLGRYKPALIAMGFDFRTFKPTQPVRLANQTRADNGAIQSLLWIR
jgi:hypothetical protein